MPTKDEICRLDAVALAHMIRAKEISPGEVVDAVLARMDRLQPALHAFCTPPPDAARAQARRVEQAVMAGERLGPLAGVPVSIKDLICTRGVRTVSGSAAYAEFVPDEDDIVVERLKAAGAVILGKTNVPEFGYAGVTQNPVFETTRNPWNTALTPGGSSGGAGAAVAAGMGPLALRSDRGGALRGPAGVCGLFGVKASMGRVPLYPGCRDERYPGVSSWESIEHLGPMTRTVADSALMLSVLAGPDDRDRHSLPRADFDWMESLRGSVRGWKVAYSPDWGYATIDPRVRDVVGKAVKVFERELGCVVEEAHPGWGDLEPTFWALVAVESDLRGMRAMAARLGDKVSPHLRGFLDTPFTAEDLTDAITARKAVCNRMWKFMRRYDILLTPTLGVPPFPLGIQGPEVIDGKTVSPYHWLAFTFQMNMTGQPAASIPAGFTADGLPVGMQMVGRPLPDPGVLRAAAAFEAAAPWRDRWPSIAAAQ